MDAHFTQFCYAVYTAYSDDRWQVELYGLTVSEVVGLPLKWYFSESGLIIDNDTLW